MYPSFSLLFRGLLKVLLALLMVAYARYSNAQMVSIRTNTACLTQLADVWTCTIDNRTPQTLAVIAEVVVTDAQQKICYKARATNVSAVTGWTRLTSILVNPNVETMPTDGALSAQATYNVAYSLYDNNNNLLYNTQANLVVCDKQPNITTTDSLKAKQKHKQRLFQLNGRGYASTMYQDAALANQTTLNGWSQRAELTETLSFGIVPIDVTEQIGRAHV